MIDRRTVLRFAVYSAAGRAAGATRVETLSDWLALDDRARRENRQLCLERIRELDPSIHAWVEVRPQEPTRSGKLAGIPFGVKDVIETRGLATEYGSAVYKGRRGTIDAAIVRDLRRLGGVLLGKTHTAAFAYRTPGPTRNPRNLEHTPGGSSSGSAAAVAAGMVPFALGTQTRGSVLRPASFCGITGFKPSFGVISTEGVLPLAKSLDTVGFFTHTARDAATLWECLGNRLVTEENLTLGVSDPLPEIEKEMEQVFLETVAGLRDAGLSVQRIPMAQMLAELDAATRVVMTYEGARVHEQRFKEHGDRLDRIADLVREGLKMPDSEYAAARQLIARSKQEMSKLFQTTPVILTPAATGPAPAGLATTGDPRMNAPWTALGTPAISIPMPVAKGLPLGLQITADFRQDGRVLQTAIRIESILASKSRNDPSIACDRD